MSNWNYPPTSHHIIIPLDYAPTLTHNQTINDAHKIALKHPKIPLIINEKRSNEQLKTKSFLLFLQVGNALVCIAVYTNYSMRTVTNIYIVNLAIADFLVILVCLPPSVLWDVTNTWFFGNTLCKFITYFQVSWFRRYVWLIF